MSIYNFFETLRITFSTAFEAAIYVNVSMENFTPSSIHLKVWKLILCKSFNEIDGKICLQMNAFLIKIEIYLCLN